MAAYEETLARMEPGIPYYGSKDAALPSIAISLKRIADLLAEVVELAKADAAKDADEA